MFIISLKKSVLITYLGIVFGIISTMFAFNMAISNEIYNMNCSLIFLILAGICDMFDGKIARKFKRTKEEKEFGIQIDSLADTINFVILPIIILLSLRINSIIALVVYMLFAICGISRLAVFNCNADLDKPVKEYTGLPVTSVAVIYPLLGLLYRIIDDRIFNILSIIITFLVAVLFISKIKIPKFKKKAYIVLPIIGLIVSILLVVKNVL